MTMNSHNVNAENYFGICVNIKHGQKAVLVNAENYFGICVNINMDKRPC